MKKSIRRIIWPVAIVLVGALLVSVPVHRARAATSPSLMTLDPSSFPATLVSQTTIAGQDVVTNWTDASGDTITIAGPAGTVLNIYTFSETLPSGVLTSMDFMVSPPVISTALITGDQAIARYAASGLSLYQDALAVGFSTTEAQQMVNEDSKYIISHVCANWTWKGIASSHECDDQRLLQSNGSSDWYIGNKNVVSVAPVISIGANALEGFRVWDTYKGHGRIDWDPQNDISEGSCKSVTLTASAPNNDSVSETRNVCPQKLVPYFPPIAGFGARWEDTNGLCADQNGDGGPVVNDPSVSVEYDAGGAPTDNYSLHGKPWYIPNDCINAG